MLASALARSSAAADQQQNNDRRGKAGRGQPLAPPLAREQRQQHQRVIFEQAGDQVKHVAAEPIRPRSTVEGAAPEDQQEDHEIVVGAFERVDRHRRQYRQSENQGFAARGRADHDGERQHEHQVEAEADRRRRARAEKARRDGQPQLRIDVGAAERVARVGQIDIDPQPLTFGGGQDGVDVEKRKTKGFDPEQLQNVEVKRVPPGMPREGQRPEEAQRRCGDRQAIGQSAARGRCFWCRVGRGHVAGASLRRFRLTRGEGGVARPQRRMTGFILR